LARSITILAVIASFIVGLSFSAVYAGVLDELICDGCVNSSDIANNDVKRQDLKNNLISSAKINNGAVKSVDIGDGTITLADLAPGVVPTIYRNSVRLSVNFGSVSCDTGDTVTGGGGLVVRATIGTVAITATSPTLNPPNAWSVHTEPLTGNEELVITVICADTTAPFR